MRIKLYRTHNWERSVIQFDTHGIILKSKAPNKITDKTLGFFCRWMPEQRMEGIVKGQTLLRFLDDWTLWSAEIIHILSLK